MMTAKPRRLTARVTYLEMQARAQRQVPAPSRPRLAIMRGENVPVAFYRYLYEQVGRDYHWCLRRVMPDKALYEVINAQTTRIDILYADGCAAGFFELDTSGLPASVEIAYFGLCRDYLGMGIGKWFLQNAIDAGWDHNPGKLTVHTNTLDNPRALPLYQRMGFEPVGIGEETVDAWQ
jgi:GNAT superfamily N-acetyltransferase